MRGKLFKRGRKLICVFTLKLKTFALQLSRRHFRQNSSKVFAVVIISPTCLPEITSKVIFHLPPLIVKSLDEFSGRYEFSGEVMNFPVECMNFPVECEEHMNLLMNTRVLAQNLADPF